MVVVVGVVGTGFGLPALSGVLGAGFGGAVVGAALASTGLVRAAGEGGCVVVGVTGVGAVSSGF